MTETPYNPLARLAQIQKNLNDEQNHHFESRLIGALSAMVSREQWERALEGAANIFPQTHSLLLSSPDPLPANLPQFEGFEYTGFRIPEVGEYFVSGSVSKNPLEWLPGSHKPLMCTTSDVHAGFSWISKPRYILRKLPAAQEEKP